MCAPVTNSTGAKRVARLNRQVVAYMFVCVPVCASTCNATAADCNRLRIQQQHVAKQQVKLKVYTHPTTTTTTRIESIWER